MNCRWCEWSLWVSFTNAVVKGLDSRVGELLIFLWNSGDGRVTTIFCIVHIVIVKFRNNCVMSFVNEPICKFRIELNHERLWCENSFNSNFVHIDTN